MIEYLLESYNGSAVNMVLNAVYYCYTLKDLDTGKYYAGSRGVAGTDKHDLLKKYFTSSTAVDFVAKLENFPNSFEYRIEYFSTRSAAFDAETVFHKKHNVGKNPMFINSITAGGTNCGAGTVLCRGSDGKIYRVTIEEYATGNHRHISSGLMNIRTEKGIKKISVKEYDPKIHTTEFENYVMAIDTSTGKKCRIPKEMFTNNAKYVGVTKGIVMAIDTITGETVSVSHSEFYMSDGRYKGITYGKFPAIEISTGLQTMISKEDFDRSLYKHHNEGMMGVYSLKERKNVQITREEYQEDITNYANLSTKVFYEVDDVFFKSKDDLDEYYRRTRGKTILKTKQLDMQNKFNDVRIILKEDHQNGKN